MIHDEAACCFRVQQGKETAYLRYRFITDTPQSVDFYTTFVPTSLRGQGIAEQLVRAGLAWAREENYQIQASCWYVEKFLRRRARKSD